MPQAEGGDSLSVPKLNQDNRGSHRAHHFQIMNIAVTW
jgi:hypothetical protein